MTPASVIGERPSREGMVDLVAPRRVFKRKRRKGLITALKVLLPLIAVSCVAYIVYWSRQAPIVHPIEVLNGEKNASSGTADVKVQKVQFNGVDSSDRPFSITAQN